MIRAEAPARTLTFLFSDIEGSTRLWERFPEAMRLSLARHDAILHDAVTEAGGEVVKTTGDGIMAVFASSTECLRACVASQLALQRQEWGETGPLSVRMGVHTGEVLATTADFHGPTVNRAARIMSAGHGGQILLSAATRALLQDDLPDDWSLRDLGEHRLKGIGRPERVFQLVHPDLRSSFPELAAVSERARELPGDSSVFVGREAELGQLIERLGREDVRIITLTGPGGIGKTRLALRAATEVKASYEGTLFVDLSPVRDTDAVLLAIAREVGLADSSEQAQLEQLVAHIRDQHLLIVLDNFEQVTEAAPLVAQLLRGCPRLQLLVTSREPLRVRGEHLFPVPPLELPEVTPQPPSPEQLGRFEAIQLFVERARAVRPDFRLTDENAAAVLEICRRLDGLPLAIELATARIGLFSPEALRDRLGKRLDLLRRGARDLPERQQTLRATIEWSHQLLAPGEQEVFALLAAFSGAAMEDIEAVVGRLPERLAGDPLEALASLVDRSLVRQAETAEGAPRFLMLETIREYALERLDEDADLASAVRSAHAQHFAEFAADQARELAGPHREAAIVRMAIESENLRACWHYWVAARSVDRLDALVDALWPLYDAKGWNRATIELATDMLDVLAGTPLTPERLTTEVTLRTNVARVLMAMHGYTEEVEQAYERAIELFGEDAEARQQLPVLRGLASFYLYRAEFDKAAEFGRRILALAEASEDLRIEVHGRLVLGSSLLFLGDVPGGLRELDVGIEMSEAHGYLSGRFGVGNDPRVVSLTTSALGHWLLGDLDVSLERADRALGLAAALGHPSTLAYARFHTGLLHLWRAEPALVRDRAVGAIQVADEADLPIWRAIGTCLLGAASTALGHADTGLAQVREGLELYRGLTTPPVFWALLLFLHAWACHQAGRSEEGLLQIDQAVALNDSGGRSPVLAELLILRGDLRLQDGGRGGDPFPDYERAFAVATALGVEMSRLRAVLRLARAEAAASVAGPWRTTLGEVYAGLSEGLDTADLRTARELLGAGSSGIAAS